MEKFKIGNQTYNIIETIESDGLDTTDHRPYQIKRTNCVSRRTIFPIVPVIIFGQLCWFKHYEVVSRLQYKRVVKFDDGLSFENPWLKWKRSWIDERITKL